MSIYGADSVRPYMDKLERLKNMTPIEIALELLQDKYTNEQRQKLLKAWYSFRKKDRKNDKI